MAGLVQRHGESPALKRDVINKNMRGFHKEGQKHETI